MNLTPLDCRVVHGMIELGCTQEWQDAQRDGFIAAMVVLAVILAVFAFVVVREWRSYK